VSACAETLDFDLLPAPPIDETLCDRFFSQVKNMQMKSRSRSIPPVTLPLHFAKLKKIICTWIRRKMSIIINDSDDDYDENEAKLDAYFQKFPLLTELSDCFMLGGI
jgi:hypothetical protein